jgi:hypothetical protein
MKIILIKYIIILRRKKKEAKIIKLNSPLDIYNRIILFKSKIDKKPPF